MRIFDLYNTLAKDDFSFAYLDDFSDTATDALIAIQDARLAHDRKARKKVSFLITECYQNVVRHGIETDFQFDRLFGLRSVGNKHSIVTVNPVENEKQKKLEGILEKLVTYDKEELRRVYKESLDGNEFSNKGGAGLGLIEMARKANRFPTYNFRDLEDGFSEFKLELAVSSDKTEYGEEIEVSTMGDIFPKLKEDRVLLMQKGDFSQESVLSLFELIENNLQQKNEKGNQAKQLYLLIELLQNMSTNTIETDGIRTGIFQIKLGQKNELIFETGNRILKEHAVVLKEHLESIIGLGKIELLKKYNKELMSGLDEHNDDPHGGIGLMEIAKLCEGNLSYKLDDIDDQMSFISITAEIR